MARQVGTVVGVAGLVALLSHVSPVDPLVPFRHGTLLTVAFFTAAGVVSAAVLAGRPVAAPVRLPSADSSPAPAPVPAPAEAI